MTRDDLARALADRYAIGEEIGHGGMARVFLSEDLKHRRRVAVKVLDPELAGAIGPERFLAEIETAARLTHPHILPLHDSGAAGGLLYYVMPYVEGESLRDRLRREVQLPVDDALRITCEVADALGYAHRHGVVHRDVKPDNILLEEGHAVIADFGIARVVAQVGERKLTQTGFTVGTPAYMSPEQGTGVRALDGRSDLYGLGCVLYEMLAGQPPFTGPTAASLAHQHLSVSPRAVTDLRPDVPAGVVAALQRALAKSPADRQPSIAAFAAELAGAPGGAARSASGSTPAAAATTLAVTGPTLAVTAPTLPMNRPAARRRIVSALAALALLAAVAAGIWIVAALLLTTGPCSLRH
jgi:serine/threonine-protein kinase